MDATATTERSAARVSGGEARPEGVGGGVVVEGRRGLDTVEATGRARRASSPGMSPRRAPPRLRVTSLDGRWPLRRPGRSRRSPPRGSPRRRRPRQGAPPRCASRRSAPRPVARKNSVEVPSSPTQPARIRRRLVFPMWEMPSHSGMPSPRATSPPPWATGRADAERSMKGIGRSSPVSWRDHRPWAWLRRRGACAKVLRVSTETTSP